MEIEKNFKKGSELSNNDLPSPEALSKALGIVPNYLQPFEKLPSNMEAPLPNMGEDVPVKPTAESTPPDVAGEATGASKSLAKTGESVLNAPANTWNMLMEVAAINDKYTIGKYADPEFYRSKKAATIDLGIPSPRNDREEFGFQAANFVTQVAAGASGYGLAGGSFLTGSALGSLFMTLQKNPSDPQIVPQALKFVGQSFDGSPIFGALADAATSLGQKLESPDGANPDVQRLYGLLDSMIMDAGTLLGTKAAIKTFGTMIEHVPQATKLLRNERGSIGEGGGKPPVPPKEGSVDDVAARPQVGRPKDISVNITSDIPVLPQNIRDAVENIDIEALMKQTEGQANLGPTAKVAPTEASIQRELESAVTAEGKLKPLTNEELAKKAIELWGNDAELRKVLLKPPGSAFTDVERAAVQLERKASSYRLAQDADELLANSSPENAVKFKEQYLHAVKVKILDMAGGSMSGKALAVEQAEFKGKLAGAIDNYLTMSGGLGNVVEMAKELKTVITNVGGVEKVLEKVVREMDHKATPLEALIEVSKQSMLSGVGTSLKILSSNIFQIARQQIAVNMTAAKLTAFKDPLADAAWKAAAGSNKALTEAVFSEFFSSLKTSMATLDQIWKGNYTSRFDLGYRSKAAMTPEALGVTNRAGASFIRLLGGTSRALSSGPILVDRYTDALAHAQHLNYLAPLKAFQKGLKGAEEDAFIAKVMDGPVEPRLPAVKSPESLAKYDAEYSQFKEIEKIWNEVTDYREKVKLTQEPEGTLGKVYNAILQDEVKGIPALRMLSPFLRTKINLVQDTWDSFGIGRFMSQTNRDIIEKGGMEAELLKSKLLLGNTILTLGAMGGAAGVVKGLGTISPEVRKNQVEAGIKKGTVGNKLQLDYAGPVGKMMALGADFGKALQYVGTGIMDKKWEADVLGALTFATASLGQNLLLDDTVSQLMVAFASGNERDVEQGQKELGQAVGAMAPIPGLGLLRSIRNEVDPYKRVTDLAKLEDAGALEEAIGASQQVLAKLMGQLPGASSQFPEALDTLGYPIEHTGGFGVLRGVQEFTEDQIEKNSVLRDMMRLGFGNSVVTPELEKQGVQVLKIPPMPKDISLISGVSIPLTAKQVHEMTLISLGKLKANMKGTVENELRNILGSDSTDGVKIIRIEQLFAIRRKVAKMEMLNRHPELMQKYKQAVSEYANTLTGDLTKDVEE